MADDAARLVQVYTKKNLTFGTAESLTGGMIASMVASVSGASAVLMGGVVAYDARIKRDVLHVQQQVIDVSGVVSAPCARQPPRREVSLKLLKAMSTMEILHNGQWSASVPG